MPKLTSFQFRAISLIVPIAAIVCAGCAGCRGGGPPPDGTVLSPTSAEYQTAITTFYVGLAALESGDNTRAQGKFATFTAMLPDEAAGWANFGLYNLRNGQDDVAATQLEKARALVPEAQSGPILSLLGLTESRRGKPAEAIGYYRKVITLEPENLKARYALAMEIERQGSNNSDSEALKVYRNILVEHPTNLAAGIQVVRLAAKLGDVKTLKDAVAHVKAMSAGWNPQSRTYIDQVEAGTSHPHSITTAILFLNNVLKAEPAFRESLAALQDPPDNVGQPIERLYKLQTPPSTPAPADTALTFHAEPASATLGMPQVGWTGCISPDEESVPVVLASDGRSVHLDNGSSMPFPGSSTAAMTSNSIALVDWNNDFKVDIALAGSGGIKLFQQSAKAVFTDITPRSKLPASITGASTWGIWPADIDSDGDLDLVVAPTQGPVRVLQNNNDGTFRVLTPFPGVSDVRGFAWGDWNADGADDAAFLDAHGTLHVFSNERSGLFKPWPVPNSVGKVAAITVAEVNGDGRMDLVVLKADGAILRLSSKLTGKVEAADWDVAEIAQWKGAASGLQAGAARLFAADLDNNGSIDLVASTPTGSQVWLSDPKGVFASLAAPLDLRVFAVEDMTGDGRLDLLGISKTGAPTLAVNKGAKNYHFVTIHPRAATHVTGDQRINSFAVGGEIRVRSGLLVQTQPISGPSVHFGLGENTTVDLARFVWPNGAPQAEFDLQTNQIVRTDQRLKGSCPWVFTYDGHAMQFAGDFLWRSPLGLRINAQNTAGVAMTEEWLKIPGERLVARNGVYDIRITAELWETHFFDHVSLMAVDHPADSAAFVDDRFAIPPPPLKVYSMTQPRPVAHAVDDRGTDVTDIVRAHDGKYLDTFGRGAYQGVTRDHYVECELGSEAPKSGPLYLIATGWIHPTDSSINVAISQGHHDAPHGLSLEVADGKGAWTVAKPNLGFPAGKIKSILIRLDDAFRPGAPRRFRLRTNMEIYWDTLETASELPASNLRTQRISPSSADLRYRGYSVANQAGASSPELPEYDHIAATGQRWRDLIGYCTRYGDVRELLGKVDDRYVIMNAGDEMRFQFPALPAAPQGWKRDFVLIGDGWEKDGDLNTMFSKTVLPLPSHDNPAYNRPPTRLEDDPVYRLHAHDWQVYHTRYVTPDGFQNALRSRLTRADAGRSSAGR